MRTQQMYRSRSLRQVQVFLTAHADAVSAANASDARKQLDAAITGIDALVTEQGTSGREVRGEVQRRQKLETTLVRKYLTPLSKFARASLAGTPEFAALTPSAGAFQRERLVQAAKAMAAAADKHVAALSAAKFPPQFLQQLRAAADAVQASFEAGTAKRVSRTGATQKIATALAQGRRAVASLDSVVSHLIIGDERLEREWRAAKRVRRAGVAEDEAVVGSIAPAASTTEVKTAAA